MKEILNFIDGQYVKCASGKTFEKRTPIDNSLVGLVYEAGQAGSRCGGRRGPRGTAWALGQAAGERAGQASRRGCRRDQPPLRRLSGSRGRRHRQAAYARLARGHSARRGQLQDLCRHDQERRDRIVRDDHARWQDGAQLHRARRRAASSPSSARGTCRCS